jgi:hypothetical protein
MIAGESEQFLRAIPSTDRHTIGGPAFVEFRRAYRVATDELLVPVVLGGSLDDFGFRRAEIGLGGLEREPIIRWVEPEE